MKDSITPKDSDECAECGRTYFEHVERPDILEVCWKFTPKSDATPSKEAKHTAGPWTSKVTLGDTLILDAKGRVIAYVVYETEVELIARAPLLLQEVEDLRKQADFFQQEEQKCLYEIESLKQLVKEHEDSLPHRALVTLNRDLVEKSKVDESEIDRLRERNRVLEEAAKRVTETIQPTYSDKRVSAEGNHALDELREVLSRNESKTPNEE